MTRIAFSSLRVIGSSCFIRNAWRFPCNWNDTAIVEESVAFILSRLPSSCLLSPGTHCEQLIYRGAKVANVFNDGSTLLSAPSCSQNFSFAFDTRAPLCRELNTCALNCRPCLQALDRFGSWGKVHPVPCIDPLLALLSRRRRSCFGLVDKEDRKLVEFSSVEI